MINIYERQSEQLQIQLILGITQSSENKENNKYNKILKLMNKDDQKLKKSYEKDFIYKILSDKEIHEKWQANFHEYDRSLDSILLNDEPSTIGREDPLHKQQVSSNKLKFSATNDYELNKRSFESTCFQNRLCQTICEYQKKVKVISQIVFETIQSVNEILSYLQLQHSSILNFMRNQNEDDLHEGKAETYLEEKMSKILSELDNYRHNSEVQTYQQQLAKQKKKMQSFLVYLNKNTQKNERLKKKVHRLETERIQLKKELQNIKNILEETQTISLQVQLSSLSNSQLRRCVKNLIKRIISHEKKYSITSSLTANEIKFMTNQRNATAQKPKQHKENAQSLSPVKKMSKPPLSPRLTPKK